MTPSRRRVLELVAAGTLTLAGCGAGPGDGTRSDTGTTDGGTPTDTPAPTPTDSPTVVGGEPTVTKLVADDADSEDGLGWAVDIAADGRTLLAGAPDDEDPNGEFAGSAYLFERRDGEWGQAAKLTVEEGTRDDAFGDAVALSADGTTALVAAPEREPPDVGVDGAGTVYVFERRDGDWERTATLANAETKYNELGGSLALSDDGRLALLGAPGEQAPDQTGDGGGAAYVFERSGGTWRRRARLVAADRDPVDAMGESAALSADGSVALLGAPREEDPNGEDAGSAYLFERRDGTWRETAELLPDDGDAGDDFGRSVALSADGNRAVVGANGDENPTADAGSAYVFERSGGAWRQRAKLLPTDADGGDLFGWSAALSSNGRRALVGARDDEDPDGEGAGAAYLFERDGGEWRQQAKLDNPGSDEEDAFGASVSVAGLAGDDARGVLAVGAPDDEGYLRESAPVGTGTVAETPDEETRERVERAGSVTVFDLGAVTDDGGS